MSLGLGGGSKGGALPDIAEGTTLGRAVGAGTGVPVALTAAQQRGNIGLTLDASGHLSMPRIYFRDFDRYLYWTGSDVAFNWGLQINGTGLNFGARASGSIAFGVYGSAGSTASQPFPAYISAPAPFVIQLGFIADTVPTTQTIKSHDVTTGVGADLDLKGGTGSTGNGVTRVYKLVADGPLKFGTYTVATVPDEAVNSGCWIEVSDETGGPTLARSNGTNWLRVADQAIIS
jgi:hypothetical protein